MPDQAPSMPPLPEGDMEDDYGNEGFTAKQMQAFRADGVRDALAGVLEALEAGHDALAAAATDYHTTMAGYRPHMHKAMDAEVANVKAVLERVRASLAELKGKP